MTKYRLSKPAYMRLGKDDPPGTETYLEAGTEVEWEGPPTLGMEAVNDEGRAKCKERDEKRNTSKEQAVKSGHMSRVMAENVGPKTEPLPEAHDDDDDDDDDDKPSSHKRGTTGRSKR